MKRNFLKFGLVRKKFLGTLGQDVGSVYSPFCIDIVVTLLFWLMVQYYLSSAKKLLLSSGRLLIRIFCSP